MTNSLDDGDTQGQETAPATTLTSEDCQHLQTYTTRCDLLRDRTITVAKRYQNGLYVVGRSGSGKTVLVRTTLGEISATHIYRSSRMTPMGLYMELALHPEYVIVLDDVSTLLTQPVALQILMAATGGEPGQPRLITYSTHSKLESFYFSGGIIAISNVPLQRDPLANALASRAAHLEFEPTDDELIAVMRDAASKGFMDLTADECRMVVEFVIDESRASDYRLDLRCMKKAWQDFRQHKNGHASCSWQELIRSSLRQIVRPALKKMSKGEQIQLECQRVREAILRYPGDTAKQMSESGLKKTTFYDRLRIVKGFATTAKR